MFQLIVTLLAIALAAIAAIAAAWYGGDAFNSGSAAAQAELFINAAQQWAGWMRLAAADQAAGAAVPAQPSGTPYPLDSWLGASAQSALGDGACAPWAASPQSGGAGLVVNGGTACSMPGFTPGGPSTVLIGGTMSAAVCAAVNQAAIGAAGSATSGGNKQFGCDPNEIFYYAVPM